MTKRLITFLLVLALATVGSAVLYAQQADQNAGQAGEHHGEHMGGPMNSQAMLDHMTKELNLTSDQQTKIKTILDDQQKQAQTVRDDTSLSQQDRMSKMRDIHKSTIDQIRTQLTADQQTKFDEMQKKMMSERGRGMGGNHPHGDQSSTPPPPPQQ